MMSRQEVLLTSGDKMISSKSVKISPIFICIIFLFCVFFYRQWLLLEDEYSTENIVWSCKEDFVLIWWTPFTQREKYIKCGNICCLLTNNRKWKNHENSVIAFLFYGSFFDGSDLPLPRDKKIWGLLHEESPRNSPLLNHEPILSLFNYSSTFSRFSNLPLTLQYLRSLKSITSHHFYKTFEQKKVLNLSDVVYIQSDCITPNNRDSYVKELMEYITIDSYGSCLNNRKLPKSLSNALETMLSPDLLQLIGNYKFAVAFENAACEDYITEKLWRPLISGSIPIYIGSPSVKDWLPNDNAAIFPSDFSTPKDLANYLHYLSTNPEAYNIHLQHKTERKIHNKFLENNFQYFEKSFKSKELVNEFECMICEMLFNKQPGTVSKLHYDCPSPVSILSRQFNISNWWHNDYLKSKCEASALRYYIDNSLPYNSKGLEAIGIKFLNEKYCDIPS